MKKEIRIISLLLAVLFTAFCFIGCGEKKNFYSALKEIKDVEHFEYEGVVSVTGTELTDSIPISEIKLSGVYADNKNASMEISLKLYDKDSYINLTNLYLIENSVYVDIRSIIDAIDPLMGEEAIGLDASMLLEEGESYYVLPLTDLEDGAVSPLENSDVYSEIIRDVIDVCLDFAEQTAKEVKPSMLSEKNGVYSFEISDKNVQSFVNKLGDVIEKNYETTVNSLISKYEGKGGAYKDAAEELKAAMDEQKEYINDTIKEMKEYKYEEETEFNANASVEVTGNKGYRIVKLNASAKQEENSVTISLTLNEDVKTKLQAPENIISEKTEEKMGELFADSFSF